MVESVTALEYHNDYGYAFENCDFSECLILDHKLIEKDLKKGKNYFVAGRPPILRGSMSPLIGRTSFSVKIKNV